MSLIWITSIVSISLELSKFSSFECLFPLHFLTLSLGDSLKLLFSLFELFLLGEIRLSFSLGPVLFLPFGVLFWNSFFSFLSGDDDGGSGGSGGGEDGGGGGSTFGGGSSSGKGGFDGNSTASVKFHEMFIMKAVSYKRL